MSKTLDDRIIAQLARQHGVEPAAVKAIAIVESAGEGFLPDGRCKILFEGHIFWRQLVIAGLNPKCYTATNRDILYEVWDKSKYTDGCGEYVRLEKAMRIHRAAALKSASYGYFQIMGFNHRLCGQNTIDAFVADMNSSGELQLKSLLNYLESRSMLTYLERKDWAAFAIRYNGPGYAKNKYDKRLQQAYDRSVKLNEL